MTKDERSKSYLIKTEDWLKRKNDLLAVKTLLEQIKKEQPNYNFVRPPDADIRYDKTKLCFFDQMRAIEKEILRLENMLEGYSEWPPTIADSDYNMLYYSHDDHMKDLSLLIKSLRNGLENLKEALTIPDI